MAVDELTVDDLTLDELTWYQFNTSSFKILFHSRREGGSDGEAPVLGLGSLAVLKFRGLCIGQVRIELEWTYANFVASSFLFKKTRLRFVESIK